MPDQRRFEKTLDKIRSRGLPAATHNPRNFSLGDGSPCDGCGETVEPSEGLLTVTILEALSLRFHEACYAAWSTFKEEHS
jgi:hypothetical protein